MIYAPASGSSPQHFVSPLTTFSQTHCSILAWSGSLPWAQMVPRGGNLATVLNSAGSHSCNVQHSGFRRNQLPDNMESEDLEAIWFYTLRLLHCSETCVCLTNSPSTSTETPCILSRFSSCVFSICLFTQRIKNLKCQIPKSVQPGNASTKRHVCGPVTPPLPRIS